MNRSGVAILAHTMHRANAVAHRYGFIPADAVRLSPRSILHYGAGRGYRLEVLVVVARWGEFDQFSDAIAHLEPCFCTAKTPEIRWLIEQ